MCVFLSSYFGNQFKSLTVSVVRSNKRLFIQELVIVINLLKRFPLRFSSKVTPGTSMFAKLCLWWIPISIYIFIYPSSTCEFRLDNVSVSEFILVSDFWVFQSSSYLSTESEQSLLSSNMPNSINSIHLYQYAFGQ